MTCYHPLYRLTNFSEFHPQTGKPLGKVLGKYGFGQYTLGEWDVGSVHFKGELVPCGQCYGCRLERSRQWALRLMHEVKFYDYACFITLTYDDEHLPKLDNGEMTLVLKDFQDFFKRLRARVAYDYPNSQKLKMFHCGEYGDLTERPHYHAIILGFDFPDRILKYTKGSYPHYVSDYLNDIWGKGLCEVCNVSFDTCAYVARYIMKKITGDAADIYYNGRKPEYTTMSNGIGKTWFNEYKSDVYNNDELIFYRDGKPLHLRPPRYYDYLFDIDSPIEFAKIKAKRQQALLAKPFEPKRLLVKEKIKKIKTKDLKRSLE